jgi:hypothetical protein
MGKKYFRASDFFREKLEKKKKVSQKSELLNIISKEISKSSLSSDIEEDLFYFVSETNIPPHSLVEYLDKNDITLMQFKSIYETLESYDLVYHYVVNRDGFSRIKNNFEVSVNTVVPFIKKRYGRTFDSDNVGSFFEDIVYDNHVDDDPKKRIKNYFKKKKVD